MKLRCSRVAVNLCQTSWKCSKFRFFLFFSDISFIFIHLLSKSSQITNIWDDSYLRPWGGYQKMKTNGKLYSQYVQWAEDGRWWLRLEVNRDAVHKMDIRHATVSDDNGTTNKRKASPCLHLSPAPAGLTSVKVDRCEVWTDEVERVQRFTLYHETTETLPIGTRARRLVVCSEGGEPLSPENIEHHQLM